MAGSAHVLALVERDHKCRPEVRPGYLDAWVTHEPRCSRIGPSLTFAIIAAPNRSAANVNATQSRHMPPSLIRIQRLFVIDGYLVHMTAQGSRAAIRKRWQRTRTSGSWRGTLSLSRQFLRIDRQNSDRIYGRENNLRFSALKTIRFR